MLSYRCLQRACLQAGTCFRFLIHLSCSHHLGYFIHVKHCDRSGENVFTDFYLFIYLMWGTGLCSFACTLHLVGLGNLTEWSIFRLKASEPGDLGNKSRRAAEDWIPRVAGRHKEGDYILFPLLFSGRQRLSLFPSPLGPSFLCTEFTIQLFTLLWNILRNTFRNCEQMGQSMVPLERHRSQPPELPLYTQLKDPHSLNPFIH